MLNWDYYSASIYIRLYDKLEEAKAEGWRNIMDHTLKLRDQYVHITKLCPLPIQTSTRRSIIPKSIFLHILTPSIKHLVNFHWSCSGDVW
jgi:hypothetical protein